MTETVGTPETSVDTRMYRVIRRHSRQDCYLAHKMPVWVLKVCDIQTPVLQSVGDLAADSWRH